MLATTLLKVQEGHMYLSTNILVEYNNEITLLKNIMFVNIKKNNVLFDLYL